MALSQTGGHGDTRPRTQPVDACACCAGGIALSRIADGVAECRRAARDELRKGATQIKIVASGGVASPYDPIWNLQYSEEEVRAIVEEAGAWHTYVMAHAYSPEAIRRSIDFGVRSIEHANLIDRGTAEHVAGTGAFVVPTLVTYDALHRFGRELGFPEVSMAKLADVREAGLSSLEILQAAAVKIGFGTDLLGPMHRHQSREFVIRAEAMSPFDIIRSATIVNAELLNRSGELGIIAPGARADLIAVDGNPLADISLLDGQGEHIDHIMKDGVFYKRGSAHESRRSRTRRATPGGDPGG
jgi:imidazolonepropionase-like amidohydrolase